MPLSRPNKHEIYFIFPYRGVGGVPVLFLRVGEGLAHLNLATVYIVDYVDGAMAKNMKSSPATLIPYSEEVSVRIPKNAIAVFQSLRPWMIDRGILLDHQTKILFWNCHPFNLVPTLPGFRRCMQKNVVIGTIILQTILYAWKNKMVKLIELLIDKKSLVFMDYPNVFNTEQYLHIKIENPKYLPIPSEKIKKDNIRHRKNYSKGVIKVFWVGRIVDFKYFILARALRDLNQAQSILNIPIEVSIIGSGEYIDRLKKDCDFYRNININFIANISTSDLDDALEKGCDILLAMGTSALEGAKFGVPTILLDISYGKVSGPYSYKWIFQGKGFTLGDMYRKDEHKNHEENTLLKRLEEIVNGSNVIGDKTLEYYEKNHSISSVLNKFIEISQEVMCTWGDIVEKNLDKRGALYSVFYWARNIYSNKK